MKTKISHLGRSTVSVILAVMMLLSTMLIGTVSTVNAVDLTKFSKVYLDANVAKYNPNEDMSQTKPTNAYAFHDINGGQSTYTEETSDTEVSSWPGGSLKPEGNGIYSILVSNDATKIIFNSVNGGKQTGNLTLPSNWKTTTMIYRGDGTAGSKGWEEYSTSVKVADSVTLTANPTSVKAGKPVTLTPTVISEKSGDLTYTYNKISGGTATEVKNADNSLTVTPTVAGTYKYKVTVSADSYSPVTSNEVSFTVTDSVKYYICGRFNNKWHDPSDNDPQFVEDESNPGLFYYETGETIAQLSGTISETYNNTTSDYPRYFYVNRAATKDSNYLTAGNGVGHNFQNNTVNTPLALMSSSGTKEEYLVRFNDVNNTSTTPVTIWLDTRNNEYKLWYTTALPHKVNVAGVSATVDKPTATAGEKVTVTATSVPQGQILDTVTVVGADGKSVDTTVSGNTATFTMPDQDVTVTNVTFREAKKYTVKFSSSDDNFGSVSAKYNGTDFTSDTKVTEGDEVTFTATSKDGYALSDWTVNGVSASSTTNPYTITVQKDTTVVANFKEVTGTLSKYYLLCGTGATFKADSYTHVPLYTNEDGVFYADFDVAKDSIPKSKDYFIIFSTKEDTSGIIVDSNNVTVNAVNKNGFSLSDYNENVQNPSGGTNNVKFAKVYIDKDDVTGFTIKITGLDLGNKKITYSAEPTFDVAPADTVEITAKDGTIRAGYTDTDASKTTAVLGDTTLSITTPDDKIITASDSYMIEEKNRAVTAKRVPNGSTVTVTTTINPNATFAGHKGSDYYVKGFSVNGVFGGVLSQTDGKNHSGDVYTYTFEVNQEIYGSKLEITPVYFLKNDDNCVYFYIENYDSAKQIWGNTPSIMVVVRQH